jgi:hypothetical protein
MTVPEEPTDRNAGDGHLHWCPDGKLVGRTVTLSISTPTYDDQSDDPGRPRVDAALRPGNQIHEDVPQQNCEVFESVRMHSHFPSFR